jgi:hypothetical protein
MGQAFFLENVVSLITQGLHRAMTKKKRYGGNPFNIRIPNGLYKTIDDAAAKMDMSKQEVIRLALEAGMEDLRLTGYNVGKALSQTARRAASEERDPAPDRDAQMRAAAERLREIRDNPPDDRAAAEPPTPRPGSRPRPR